MNIQLPKTLIALPLLILCTALFCAHSKAGAFIDIPEIPGEVVQPGYDAMIEVNAAMANFEKRSCDGLAIIKETDSASAALIAAAVSGRTFNKVRILYASVNSSNQLVTYLELILSNVTFTGVVFEGVNADAGNIPTERVMLQTSAIVLKYTDLFDGDTFEEQIECK